jgi:uncharacterized protein (TIGR02453 family)
MPMPADLARIRQEIDYDFDSWKKIISSPAFKKQFPDGVDTNDKLVRAPKGYDENNPAIEFIKMKSFIVTRPFTNAQVLDKSFIKEVTKTFQTMKPVIDFLNKAIE